LRGVDLDVVAGEALGIIGPVASGKSSLLLCLAGLMRADTGVVSWFGRAADAAGRPAGIAFLPQHPATYPFLSAREAVEYYGMLRGVPAADRADAVRAALDAAGLPPDPRTGGTDAAVRVSLAQALVGRPRILLLDETLTGVEPGRRRAMSERLRALRGEGLTIVIAADAPDMIQDVTTRVALIVEGRITATVAAESGRASRTPPLMVAAPTPASRILGSRVAEQESR
jgi:ABC-2 type transport system ATP-binding protein